MLAAVLPFFCKINSELVTAVFKQVCDAPMVEVTDCFYYRKSQSVAVPLHLVGMEPAEYRFRVKWRVVIRAVADAQMSIFHRYENDAQGRGVSDRIYDKVFQHAFQQRIVSHDCCIWIYAFIVNA